MNDERLQALLQAAVPPVSAAEPRDVWALLADRMDRRTRWSPIDVGLAAAAAAALVIFPEWVLLLAYHL